MDSATKFIAAITELYNAVGPYWSFAVVLVIFGLQLYKKYRDDQTLKNAYQATIDEKEAQIQRIAAENREWRNYFFKLHGLTEQDILKLADTGNPDPTQDAPSQTKKQSKKPRRRR